ncbi:MAG: hypothetical protein PVF85_07790 [Anaerolineales bacterium]|jgi:hypothetical protein
MTPSVAALQQTPTATVSPTSTRNPDTAVFISPGGDLSASNAEIRDIVARLASESGFRLIEVEGTEIEAALGEGTKVVVLLEAIDRIGEVAAANPGIGFIVTDNIGIGPGNIYAVQPHRDRADQTGFIAGYIAALITPDFRVGGIALNDDSVENAALQGFVNGAVFYCGLCRPSYPPFNSYPRAVVVSSVQPEDISSGIQGLKDLGVTTIYLSPGLNQQPVFDAIRDSDLRFIGSDQPTDPSGYTWVASIAPDMAEGIREAWEAWINGEDGQMIEPPITISAADPGILSVGKLDHLEAVIAELASGRYDTGIDPQTGEPR